MKSCKVPAAAALILVAAIAVVAPVHGTPAVRIKDIASIHGLRDNQLLGVGLVTGLAGKGDSSNSSLLRSSIANLVANFGLRIDPEDVRSKNCAVVTVSCKVPAFAREGEAVDVVVSSLGDARSLEGGVLLQAPLQGANGQVYAVAHGQLVMTGDGTRGTASARTVGTIPGGAVIERAIVSTFLQDDTVSILLRHPDFVTANNVAEALRGAFGEISLRAVDPARIEIEIPEGRRGDPVGFVAELESVEVTPDPSGRVLIDSASGIIIFGERVRIGKVAVSYRDVSVSVGSASPHPGYYGQLPATSQEMEKQHFLFGESTTVEELVDTLRSIGLRTEAIIPIIQAIDKAGALFGKLVIM